MCDTRYSLEIKSETECNHEQLICKVRGDMMRHTTVKILHRSLPDQQWEVVSKRSLKNDENVVKAKTCGNSSEDYTCCVEHENTFKIFYTQNCSNEEPCTKCDCESPDSKSSDPGCVETEVKSCNEMGVELE